MTALTRRRRVHPEPDACGAADALDALQKAACALRDAVCEHAELPEPHPATLLCLEALERQLASPNHADDGMVARVQGRRLARALTTPAPPPAGVPSSHVAPREPSWSASSSPSSGA